MIRSVRWSFLVFLALVAPVAAQLSDTDAREMAQLPDPPADHILDVGELFGRHPERRAAISERLMGLQSERDLPVYLVVYAGLIDSTVSRRARLIYDKWIGPDQDGVVVVYNTDTREREIVTPSRTFTSVEGNGSTPVRLQDHQMIPILAELRVTLRGVEDRIDYIDRTTEILVLRLDALLGAAPAGIGDRSMLRLVAVLLVVGVVITGMGIFVHRRMRVVEERAREQFFFPDVTVGSRLGAPFCGGCQSVVDFSRRQAAGPH